jgi:micrococcal nuclease
MRFKYISRKNLLIFAFFSTLILILGCSIVIPQNETTKTQSVKKPEQKNVQTGKVLKVIDAITIQIKIDGKIFTIKYLGLDIPNNVDPYLNKKATELNIYLVNGRNVQLEKDEIESDKFGNLLRYVYVDGEMVNQKILINGYASLANDQYNFSKRSIFERLYTQPLKEKRGFWDNIPNTSEYTKPPNQEQKNVDNRPIGTLPYSIKITDTCDFSNSQERLIKGNIDKKTKEKLYYIPNSIMYKTITIEEANNDRWFCTEQEAQLQGWVKSKH